MKKQNEMFYTISDKIDTLEDKLSNLADIIELMAVHETVVRYLRVMML